MRLHDHSAAVAGRRCPRIPAMILLISIAPVFILLADGYSFAAENSKPNIVFILADDLGYGDVSFQGQTRFQTPNIDQLAQEGMRFTSHYSGSPVCAPSRGSLMTGLHTGHALVRGNVNRGAGLPLRPEDTTIAEALQQAGYVTAGIGKWGLGDEGTTGVPNRKGFDFWYGYLNQMDAHYYYWPFLWRNQTKELLQGNDSEAQVGQYTHDLFTREALQFIHENRENPFFLYLAYTIPHAELVVPYDSLQPFLGVFPEVPAPKSNYNAQEAPHASFAGMVTRMDRDIGRVMDQLQGLGLDDKTLVIFSSDNGPHKEGGHNPEFFNSNGPLRGIKRDLYEGGIRVPTVARWPGRIEAGAVTDHPSAFWDFAVTAAEIAGVEWTAPTDGISFAPTLFGDEQKKHEFMYWEFHEGAASKQAVRMGDWKGFRADPAAPLELYDLSHDLGEEKNVAEAHPEIVEKMMDYLKTARTESETWPLKSANP